MKFSFTSHKFAYAILLIGIGAFLFYFYAVWPNRVAQRLSSLIFAIFYFFWGIATHIKTRHLTSRVVAEYFAVSLLIGLLLFLITI
ncbi:MAG: hypothetical protein ABII10_02220 [Candidatus Paceibacterota bacterium]